MGSGLSPTKQEMMIFVAVQRKQQQQSTGEDRAVAVYWALMILRNLANRSPLASENVAQDWLV